MDTSLDFNEEKNFFKRQLNDNELKIITNVAQKLDKKDHSGCSAIYFINILKNIFKNNHNKLTKKNCIDYLSEQIDFNIEEIEEYNKSKNLESFKFDVDKEINYDTYEIINLLFDKNYNDVNYKDLFYIIIRIYDFRPLGPLTGKNFEWMHVSGSIYQNRRCPTVFKKNNKSYDTNSFLLTINNYNKNEYEYCHIPIIFPYRVPDIYEVKNKKTNEIVEQAIYFEDLLN
jgi:hypothetical protein